MGVFQKIGNALARLMYGRNGVDQLSLAIVVGSLVLDLVSMFVAPHHLWLGNALYLVSIAAWAFALFRIFSRNTGAIHCKKFLVPTRTKIVASFGNHIFSRAGFPLNQ